MRFWRSVPGAILLVVLLGGVVVVGAVSVQVERVTHPDRQLPATSNLGAELAKVEEVSFRSGDGIELAGWLVRGRAGQPGIVLCHDLGASKNALINLAIVLNKAGFTVLDFDFRGHGASGGDGSTLGINEERDVLGAVDFLTGLAQDGIDVRKLGAYGTGMGAHAVVLAAADRPALRVLVLDGLWPDAGWPLVRRTFEGWSFGVKRLGSLPVAVFTVLQRASIGEHRAEALLPGLAGRDVLLVAPAGDGRLDEAMKGMYALLPERKDSERSLLTLPATQSSGLSADDLARYHERVVEFFRLRLARP
jgi:pimeloyl-ACP methyl ester carboxylesterase